MGNRYTCRPAVPLGRVSGGIGTLAIVLAWTGPFPKLRRLGRLSAIEEDSPAE
jgi:hypothetical protein